MLLLFLFLLANEPGPVNKVTIVPNGCHHHGLRVLITLVTCLVLLLYWESGAPCLRNEHGLNPFSVWSKDLLLLLLETAGARQVLGNHDKHHAIGPDWHSLTFSAALGGLSQRRKSGRQI